jgi:biotin transport system substrate-specific component
VVYYHAEGIRKMKNGSIRTTKNIIFIGLFAAITAVLSQIAIPLPTNVPLTLQTFAVALAGYFLGAVKGTVSMLVYVMLGAVGVPVFANWKGGFGVITGATGGFIVGFIFMALLCGVGSSVFSSKKLSGKVLAVLLGIAGLAVCHLLGFGWYAIFAKVSLGKSFMVVSLPYLIKDIGSVIAAYVISEELIKRLAKTGAYSAKAA